jgi:DUF4097 and DUF4098 domain-containing protein YvlB
VRHETFSTPGKVKVEINIPAGNVDIETVDGDTTSVQLAVSGRDADEHEGEAKIELHRRGDRYEVIVAARKGGFSFRSREYDVRITTPPGADIEASVASADIEGRGRYGEVRIQSASGDIEFEELAGQARIDSASGDIELRQVDSAKVNSASGDLRIDNVANGADVNTASGDVELRSVRAGEVKLNSASGDLEIGIAGGSRLWVEAQSLSGDTSSELDLESGVPIESDEGPLVELKARTLSGDINVRRA